MNVWLTYGSPGAVNQEKLIVPPLVTLVGGLMVRAETRGATVTSTRLHKIVSFFFVNKRHKDSERM